LIFNEDTGLLAEFGDIETFAAHCEALLNDAALAKQYGQRARAFIEKEFSGQTLARKYEALYRELMS